MKCRPVTGQHKAVAILPDRAALFTLELAPMKHSEIEVGHVYETRTGRVFTWSNSCVVNLSTGIVEPWPLARVFVQKVRSKRSTSGYKRRPR